MKYTSRDVYEFISKQTKDPIVQWKTCAISGTEFPISQSDLEFYDKISPSFNGVQYSIPTPTLCPEERQRRRLLFRNERKLYKRKCDASGKDIISIYAPNAPYKVYDQKFRWSDNWDPMNYGKSFDFSQTFTQQFDELFHAVPLLGLIGTNNENAEYINLTADSKNCYIVIESSNNEDCYYGYWLQQCNKTCDCGFCHECEECYETQNCHSCFGILYGNDCQNCRNSTLIKNCVGCEYCFGCINLINQKYCIFNKQVSKEEYEEFIAGALKDIAIHKEAFTALSRESVMKYSYTKLSEQAFGNYLINTKNCVFCDDGYDAEDCKYGEHVWRNAKHIMDASTAGRDAELIYESINMGISDYLDLFCAVCRNGSSSLTYCFSCFSSNNLFGCIGLRNASYCIFNKQYTREEYEKLVPQIIAHMQTTGEWGEFFSPSLSPFGYNETVAHEYFPMTKNQASERGYKWQDNTYDPVIPEGADTIKGDQIPTDITTVDDDILKKIFICEVSGRPFRIIKQELEFYRRHHLALPRKHPDIRHMERMQMRSSRQVYVRSCDKCGIAMSSAYPDHYEGKVYCEECYNHEIY